MGAKSKENAAIVGVGAAACAVCCAGPILAVVAAIGSGAAAGFVLFGAVAFVVGAVLVAFVLVRRHRRAGTCTITETPHAVPVELTDVHFRS